MITENKRIDIYGYNVNAANEYGIDNLTGFVNKLLEGFFNEDLVELEKGNKEYLDSVSKDCNKKINDIINAVLKTVEIVPPKSEKIKIELEEKNVKVKRKRSGGPGNDLGKWRFE